MGGGGHFHLGPDQRSNEHNKPRLSCASLKTFRALKSIKIIIKLLYKIKDHVQEYFFYFSSFSFQFLFASGLMLRNTFKKLISFSVFLENCRFVDQQLATELKRKVIFNKMLILWFCSINCVQLQHK